jgi:hypothetical protein
MSKIKAGTTSTTAYQVEADTTGTLVLQTGSTPTTAVTIDTSQNVGIGTSSPSDTQSFGKALDFRGTTGSAYYSGTTDATTRAYFATYSGGAYLGTETNHPQIFRTNNTERMRIDTSGNLLVGATSADARVFAYSSSGTSLKAQNPSNVAQLLIGYNNTSYNYIDADNNIFRSGNGTERARIDSSGNLLVGQTSDTLGSTTSLQVTSTGDVCSLNKNNATDGVILRFKKQGSTVGYVSTNTYSLPSDERVKSNIENIVYGLEFVNSLRPVQYNTTFQDQEKLSKKNFGLIAQEVETTLEQFGKSVDDVTFLEKFAPENDTESRYGLGYQNLVPVLIKAIQEQQALITQLQADVAALKGAA